ncbi:MAG: hypothetical protein JNK05_36040 [Myxococcales bacterium]|nr:hypothetical protein [Myxococcales bacterium]
MSDSSEPNETYQRVAASRLGRSPASVALLAAAYAPPALAAIALASDSTDAMLAMLLLWPIAVSIVFLIGATRGLFAPAARTADVLVAPSGIVINGELIPRAAITRATMVADPILDGFRLVIEDGRAIRRKHALLIEDEHIGERIIATLELGAKRATASWGTQGVAVHAPSISAPMTLLSIVAASVGVVGVIAGWTLVALVSLLAILAVFATRWARGAVVVGLDGVRVEWMGQSRYCAFADVEKVQPLANGVQLVTKDGAHFDVALFTESEAKRDPYQSRHAEVRALHNRIHEIIELRRESQSESASIDPYLRHDRSARDWLASLRRAFDAAMNLRVATNTEEAAWRVVLDQNATGEARVGAAAAIAANSDDSAREKLRVVAQSIADPRVRVALEAAASSDEQTLVNAMENFKVQKQG